MPFFTQRKSNLIKTICDDDDCGESLWRQKNLSLFLHFLFGCCVWYPEDTWPLREGFRARLFWQRTEAIIYHTQDKNRQRWSDVVWPATSRERFGRITLSLSLSLALLPSRLLTWVRAHTCTLSLLLTPSSLALLPSHLGEQIHSLYLTHTRKKKSFHKSRTPVVVLAAGLWQTEQKELQQLLI